MFLEELQELISSAREKIEQVQREIRKKTQAHDELLEVRAGLRRIEEAFQKKKEENKNVFNNPLFEKNRCMQRLRDGMLDKLGEANAATPQQSIGDSIASVSAQISNLLKEIGEKEGVLERLRTQLKSYSAQALTAVSMYETEE